MADEGYTLNEATLKRLAVMLRWFYGSSSPLPQQSRRRYEPDTEWEGEVVTGSSAPTNGWTSPTTCTVQLYKIDPASVSTPKAMIPHSMSPVTVVIRDESLAPAAGLYCRVKRINGEWAFTWLGCPP